MGPIIGVTTYMDEQKVFVNKDYMQAIIQAGGIPLSIPYLETQEELQQVVDLCDGLLLTGGEDIDPQFYGEEPHPALGQLAPERDTLEINVLRLFLTQDKPIFAICRGCQVLNVAFGGGLYQDIPSQTASMINHNQNAPRGFPFHSVKIRQESLLYQVLQDEKIKVNSYHHQAAKTVVEPLRISAVADDGIVEGLESSAHSFVLGVLWHPEGMAMVQDKHAKLLFSAFIEASQNKCIN